MLDFLHSRRGAAVFLVILAVIPLLDPGRYWLHVINVTMIYALVSLGQNIITGWCGMLTLGQAAFFGLGAYTSALLSLTFGLPFIVCFFAAGIMASIVGALLSLPCLRVRTDFLSLITIAFNQLFFVVANNWMSLTRGPMGLPQVPRIEFFGFAAWSATDHYYVFLVIVALAYFAVSRITGGATGRAWEMIRDDEVAARAVGVDVVRYKVLAFAVGCFLAGCAGSLFAHYLRLVSPDMFLLEESLIAMQMAILGGLASLPGAALGAFLMIAIPEALRSSEPWLITLRPGIGGALLVILMIWRPHGLLSRRNTAPQSLRALSAWLRRGIGLDRAPRSPAERDRDNLR
ncbi:MAG: branched-chain amino acid ABC transporter permease [Pseudomonadota bacterium]